MANVSFKRGLSTALSSITPVDGEFYLTTDSHELYVGQTNNGEIKMHLVNKNVPEVYVVESVDNNAVENPVEGALYYVAKKNNKKENSLYIYNNGFIKVNDFDTNEDHIVEVTDASFAKATSQETGKLKYTLTLNQKSKDLVLNNETVKDAVTADLVIDGSDVTGIVADVEVSPTLSISNGVVSLKNDGAGAGPNAVTISGGGATTVSGNGATLTISSPEYSFSGDENGQLVFTGADGDTTTVNLSNIFYTKNEANSQFSSAMRYKGTISDKNLNNISNPEVGDVYMTSKADTYAPVHGWTDGVAAGVGDLFIYTKDGDSNYWSYVPSANDTDTTYTVSVDSANKTFDLTASSNSDKQSVKIDGENGITVTANSADKSFKIGHSNTSTASSASVTATAALSFGDSFTIYDGLTVDGYGHVNAASKKTYQLPVAPTIPSYSLTSTATTSGASIQLKKGDSDQDEVKLLRGDEMAVSQSGSAITISHATVSLSKPTATEVIITNNTSIPSYAITTNSFGHVTAITEKDYKFSINQAVSANNNVASVTMKDALSNNISGFSVTSSSMVVTAKDVSTINVELEWGTF